MDKTIHLYGSLSLSRKHIQNFVSDTKEIVGSSLNIVKNELLNLSESTGVDVSNISRLIGNLSSSYDDIDSDKKRLAFLEKRGLYLPPIKYRLDNRFQGLKRTSSGQKKKSSVEDEAYVYLFPLRTMLKKILELPGVYDEILHYTNLLHTEKYVVSNFIQSKLWQKKIKNWNRADPVFPLIMSNDDYETGNALSGHAGQNKLAGTYINLPCFPPQYQSSLSSILHALLYYSKDREKFGNTAIFKNLIEEFRFLEIEGVELSLPRGSQKIYFKLALLTGDNL